MATPISNNNQLLIDQRKAETTNSTTSGNGNKTTDSSDETAAKRQDDAINVSNAAQVLGSSTANYSGANSVQNAAQATELAQNIATFFAENGAAALATHGNGNSDLATLLRAG